MRVRLLGTAAGGGVPQWNCNCPNCREARTGTGRVRPRTQSSVAVSADGQRWFLLNASPDVRAQIESFRPLLPCAGVRDTGIAGILLTNADLDHTLGLLVLREGGPVNVHATNAVRRALNGGLGLEDVLSCYGGIAWRQPPAELSPLLSDDGKPSGLRYAAFPVRGKPPRYRQCCIEQSARDTVGYCIEDERTNGRFVFLPTVAALSIAVLGRAGECDALVFDGTFWSEQEMPAMGAGILGAGEMGHVPVGGAGGSLRLIARLPASIKVYSHINNTNPILQEDSAERKEVEAAGVMVGYDGQEFSL